MKEKSVADFLKKEFSFVTIIIYFWGFFFNL